MSDTGGADAKTKNGQKTADELKELGREFRKRADTVREEVVKQLHNTAETIRKEANESDADPTLKVNADKLASGLEKTAHYLNSRNVDQLGEDATQVVRKNPWRTLAVVFIVGLIIGIFLNRND